MLPLRIGLQGDIKGKLMPMPLLLKGRHNAAAGWLNPKRTAFVLPAKSHYPAQLSSQQGMQPWVNNAVHVLCILSQQAYKQHLQSYYGSYNAAAAQG